MRDLFDRLLGGRQTDAGRIVRQQFKAFERDGQVGAAFVVGDSVNFVDDDGLDVTENVAAAVGGQQDVERLGRGDQDVRRTLQHLAPLFHQGVAGANGGANLRHQVAAFTGQREDFAEWDLEVLLNVVAQRLQWRNIENFGRVAQISGECLADKAIDADEKCREGFAGTGGSGDEGGAAGEDLRPTLLLGLGRRTKALDEPLGDERMGPGKRRRNLPHRHPVILS